MNQIVRDDRGRVVAGALNPGGRPKLPAEVREMAQAASPRAIAKIIGFLDHADPKVVLRAAEILLDRGYGKPVQALDARVEQSQSTADAHVAALLDLARQAREAKAQKGACGGIGRPVGDRRRAA